MPAFVRGLYVVAVALWFGSVAFFSIAGVLIFQAFDDASRDPTKYGLQHWLPEPSFAGRYEIPPEGLPRVPQERGSRLAGIAVGNIFLVYYALQTVCGIVALLAAQELARSGGGKVGVLRTLLCVLALASAGGGWWLQHKVHELRGPRNETTDRVLSQAKPSEPVIDAAREARAEFARWHNYSLIQNFTTLALVLVLTLLVPSPPTRREGAAALAGYGPPP